VTTSDNSPPGAVVVGTGFGLFTHVRALRDAGFEVRAIVGRDRARTAARAAPLGIPVASNDLDAVLADPAIQLVTVATPPHAHVKPVMQALKARRHVMCEKPFAKDLAEARTMLVAAEAAGVIHMLGAEFRFDSAQALLRRVVLAGEIGKPLHFLRIYHQPGLQDPKEELSDWWEDANQGGGFLGAFGSHMIDQIRTTLGEIVAVSAVLQTLAPGRPHMTADDCYMVQFVTDSGAKGALVAAMAAPGPLIMATKLVGTEGAAWIQSGSAFGEPEQVWVEQGGVARQIPMPAELANPPPEPFAVAELIQTEQDRWHTQGFDVAPYAKLFGEMRARMEGREPELPERAGTFRDAAAGQAVTDAVRKAAATQSWVKVEQI
jgi:predicted dehydrogenase